MRYCECECEWCKKRKRVLNSTTSMDGLFSASAQMSNSSSSSSDGGNGADKTRDWFCWNKSIFDAFPNQRDWTVNIQHGVRGWKPSFAVHERSTRATNQYLQNFITNKIVCIHVICVSNDIGFGHFLFLLHIFFALGFALVFCSIGSTQTIRLIPMERRINFIFFSALLFRYTKI